ncbi:MAG: M15 family metallopeptidase [Nitrospiraceae bacterium]|nr:M15 family metallopeptidase [Nitrospiraceae bacterium]
MSRDPNLLAPCVRLKLEALQAAAAHKQIGFEVICTLRTGAEQLALFAQGRKTLAEVNRLRHDAGLPPINGEQNRRPVTWELTSMHMFGCAFDVVVIRSGQADWNDTADYTRLGELGESLGLRWGGRFEARDLGHFEHRGGLSVAELQAGKRPEV